ncbi:hypothetical protein SCAZ3_00005 [Streptococcus canis FSL Z3-227]|uniref:Uncharacterized protein n=1 Tax=Streptococcus canis FSL Z3-227 TaxID=482234 RepID=A0AAV3FVD3_STRCB|nr:hypothetical protein SCAZ3_00005 [Streptococcus canis FSL Z3-227]
MNDTFPQAVENKKIAENKGVLANFFCGKVKLKKQTINKLK